MATTSDPRDGWLDRNFARIEPRRWSLLFVPWRAFLVFAMIGLISLTYFPASLLTAHRSYDLTTWLDASIPFVPWTWWIYFPHYVFGLIVTTVLVPDPRVLLRVFAAILLGQGMSLAGYFLLPSTYPRPLTVGDADPITAAALQWFWTVDPPNNTFPSTHVANACLGALGAWYSRHPVRWYSAIVAIGVIVTIHTAKQHYWIDAVGGMAVAFISFRLVNRWWPIAGTPLIPPANPSSAPGPGQGRTPAERCA